MTRVKSVVIFLALLTVANAQAPKKRVAVMNFDYATVQNRVASLFGTNQDVGKGIADLLVDRLVSGGVYSVIERKEIDKIVSEQNFANSDRADATTAAKIGRVLGVDAIIIGSITEFGSDDKKTDISGGGVTDRLGKFGIGGLSRSKATAVVQITARMIDTSTAEILAGVQGKGEQSKNGTGILGSGGGYGSAAAGALDMRSKNFRDTLLGASVNQAVTEVANGLNQKAAALPTRTVMIDGLVADVTGATIVVNVGSHDGVKVGDQLAVKRNVKDIRDPNTGKIIRHVEDSIGTLTITEVDGQSAVGKFSGPGQPQVKDTVSNRK